MASESGLDQLPAAPYVLVTPKSAPRLSASEREAILAELVRAGHVKLENAVMIDFREPTHRELEIGEELSIKRRVIIHKGQACGHSTHSVKVIASVLVPAREIPPSPKPAAPFYRGLKRYRKH